MHEAIIFELNFGILGLMDEAIVRRKCFRTSGGNQEGQMDAVGSPDLNQLTLLAFVTRWTWRVCPLPLANGMTLPTISTTGFLTVSIPKRR